MDDPTRPFDAPHDPRLLEQADDATDALIRLLEALAPQARFAFLMHDVFDTGYADLVDTLGVSEAACVDLVELARAHLRQRKPSPAGHPDMPLPTNPLEE